MSQYQLTSNAREDLFSILNYISAENPAAANRVETFILESCDLLANTPFAGHLRRDLTDRPVRFWAVPRYPNYLIVYDPASNPLTIIRIVHAARDLARHI